MYMYVCTYILRYENDLDDFMTSYPNTRSQKCHSHVHGHGNGHGHLMGVK